MSDPSTSPTSTPSFQTVELPVCAAGALPLNEHEHEERRVRGDLLLSLPDTNRAGVQKWEEYCAKLQPMAQLYRYFVVDSDLRSKPWYKLPPKVYYGFGLKSDRLYAIQHNLVTKADISEGNLQSRGRMHAKAWMDARAHLKKVTRAARLHLRFPVHTEHEVLLALYSNWSKDYEEMSLEHEQIVVEELKKRLGLAANTMPMWYFDADEE